MCSFQCQEYCTAHLNVTQKPPDPPDDCEGFKDSGIRPPNTLKIPISSDRLKELRLHQSKVSSTKHKYLKLPTKNGPSPSLLFQTRFCPENPFIRIISDLGLKPSTTMSNVFHTLLTSAAG
ncbi:hypothetical protein ACOME3_008804 [Neoechinorhynchus agilis]